MTRRLKADDVFAAAVPEHIDPLDGEQKTLMLAWLDRTSQDWVWHQWADSLPPQDIEFARSVWLITCDVWQVDQFQPAHDCQECRSGNEKAKDYLRANPGRWVAMANMTYTEVWP